MFRLMVLPEIPVFPSSIPSNFHPNVVNIHSLEVDFTGKKGIKMEFEILKFIEYV